MKYEIDTLMATFADKNIEALRKVVYGDPYDVISHSEAGELMDEKEAWAEFDKLSSSARKQNDGSITIRIPVLVRGEEELEDDVIEGDEPFYYLPEYEEVERKDFDDESWDLFREIGI